MKPVKIEQQFAQRGCEVCKSKHATLLYSQRFVPMSEGSLLEGYNVVACDNCGFCYADHLPGQDAFDRYYRDMSKYEQPIAEVKPSEYDAARFRVTVQKIKAFMPDNQARIVEIGCATGLLLSQLKQAGYTGVAGLDPSPACSRVANEQFKVPVQCGTLSDDLIPASSVDLLILIGVMEHIRDLETAMKMMVTMLAPGGRMFITVPDASRYSTGVDAPFQEFSVEHIHYFGPVSLANLMDSYGFDQLFCERGTIRPNVRTITPVIHGAFARRAETAGSSESKPPPYDLETESGLREYILKSQREHEAVVPALDELARSREPVLIWGAGAHTLRLLATSPLAQANLTGIIDSNPRYHGHTIAGLPILSPKLYPDENATVLVSSRVYQEDICRQIVDRLGWKNKIATLY
jgi:SAM-dependent methyltransferase